MLILFSNICFRLPEGNEAHVFPADDGIPGNHQAGFVQQLGLRGLQGKLGGYTSDKASPGEWRRDCFCFHL